MPYVPGTLPVPNSAPDSLAPRNCQPPEALPEDEDEDEAEAEAAAEAVLEEAAAWAAVTLEVSAAAGAEEVVEAAGAEDVGAAARSEELLLTEEGFLLLQFRRWTPGAARAQAARPAASIEETRMAKEGTWVGRNE